MMSSSCRATQRRFQIRTTRDEIVTLMTDRARVITKPQVASLLDQRELEPIVQYQEEIDATMAARTRW